jgi:hypothetical protein
VKPLSAGAEELATPCTADIGGVRVGDMDARYASAVLTPVSFPRHRGHSAAASPFPFTSTLLPCIPCDLGCSRPRRCYSCRAAIHALKRTSLKP